MSGAASGSSNTDASSSREREVSSGSSVDFTKVEGGVGSTSYSASSGFSSLRRRVSSAPVLMFCHKFWAFWNTGAAVSHRVGLSGSACRAPVVGTGAGAGGVSVSSGCSVCFSGMAGAAGSKSGSGFAGAERRFLFRTCSKIASTENSSNTGLLFRGGSGEGSA